MSLYALDEEHFTRSWPPTTPDASNFTSTSPADTDCASSLHEDKKNYGFAYEYHQVRPAHSYEPSRTQKTSKILLQHTSRLRREHKDTSLTDRRTARGPEAEHVLPLPSEVAMYHSLTEPPPGGLFGLPARLLFRVELALPPSSPPMPPPPHAPCSARPAPRPTPAPRLLSLHPDEPSPPLRSPRPLEDLLVAPRPGNLPDGGTPAPLLL